MILVIKYKNNKIFKMLYKINKKIISNCKKVKKRNKIYSPLI